jgi:hypothetical protein
LITIKINFDPIRNIDINKFPYNSACMVGDKKKAVLKISGRFPINFREYGLHQSLNHLNVAGATAITELGIRQCWTTFR